MVKFNMRDPNRIHKIMIKLEELWNYYPDWRFMQLICNLQAAYGSDMFYLEDDKFEEIVNFIKENGIRPMNGEI